MKIEKISWVLVLGFLFSAASCTKSIEQEGPNRDAELLKSGKAVIWTKTVQLSGLEEVPPITTTTNGVAILRLTADGVLHHKVNVDDLEPGDALRFSHIHFGAKGTIGGVFIFLTRTPDQFGMNLQTQLNESQVQILLNDPLYVNVHSNKYLSGVIRGQIR